jgi:hypothetical protein
VSATEDNPNDRPITEHREVRVSDPRLSDRTNELLTEEVREILGKDEVDVPVGRPHRARGERRPASASITNASGALSLIALMLVVVAVVALLAGASWWLVPVALLVVGGALGLIVRFVMQTTSIPEHVAPTTAAALQAEGVANPDEFVSDIVEEFTEPRGSETDEHRTIPAREDPAQASAEQKDAMTPTSDRSDAVGP